MRRLLKSQTVEIIEFQEVLEYFDLDKSIKEQTPSTIFIYNKNSKVSEIKHEFKNN